MTREPGGPSPGAAACWRCEAEVPFGRVEVEHVLHARTRAEGGPWRAWRCPACREENGALRGPSGGWLLHPLEGLLPAGLLDRLRTARERRRLAAAETWWRANRDRVERFRRGLGVDAAAGRTRTERPAPRAAAAASRPRPRAPGRAPVPRSGPRAVLGVPADATLDEIRRAWRRAAKRLHPDRAARDAGSQDEAHRRFLEVRAAFEALVREAGSS